MNLKNLTQVQLDKLERKALDKIPDNFGWRELANTNIRLSRVLHRIVHEQLSRTRTKGEQ